MMPYRVKRQKLIGWPARCAMPTATTLALAAIAVPLPEKHAPNANAHHSALPVSASGARQGDDLPDTILTPREEEVLKLIAEGYSTREIAATLGISAKTVDRHRTNTLAKLGLRDRLALTRYAIRAGLIEP
jgi:DNA-binding NarL/FixJ family response regulator